MKDQTTVKREFEEDGWITTWYPGSETRQIISDWKEEKAEEYLDEEGPELPEKRKIKGEAENVLSGPARRTAQALGDREV